MGNDFFEGVDESAELLRLLNQKVKAQLETGNLTGNVANAVALGKTMQAGANSYARMKAASDQVWSRDDMRELMRRLADAQHEALDLVLDRAGVDADKDLRNAIVDETIRSFAASFEEQQKQVTEDRANGITAFDQRLLENKEQQ